VEILLKNEPPSGTVQHLADEQRESVDQSWPQSVEEFEAVIDEYLDRLILYAFRRVGNLPDAEDVVQEVFAKAFVDRGKRKRVSRVSSYLYRMTANACVDLMRRRKVSAFPLDAARIETIPSHEKSPLEIASAKEELCRVEELLRCLPKAQAEAIRMRVFEELPLREIAEIAGCTVNTVCGRLRYGFRKLRKIVSRKRG
jgi:RNA polymerase sigma factor (sigma-70 family)